MSPPGTVTLQQAWTTTAPTYSSNVGRTSALSASRLVQLTDGVSPITDDSLVLDVGAGTGAVTFALASHFSRTNIIATDISQSMLDGITAANLPNVQTRVLDALCLSRVLDKETYSHVFNTFMLQAITTPLDALREMQSVLAPDGVIGIAVWGQRIGPFEIWQDACRTIDPSYELPAPFEDENSWRTPNELAGALESVGFGDVRTEKVRMPFEFENAEAFAEFWFGARNPASVKIMGDWPEEKMGEMREVVMRVVRDRYAGGKEIYTWAVLGVGKKSVGS